MEKTGVTGETHIQKSVGYATMIQLSICIRNMYSIFLLTQNGQAMPGLGGIVIERLLREWEVMGSNLDLIIHKALNFEIAFSFPVARQLEDKVSAGPFDVSKFM